jgi:hypothetical protein
MFIYIGGGGGGRRYKVSDCGYDDGEDQRDIALLTKALTWLNRCDFT